MDKIIKDLRDKVNSYTIPEGVDIIPPYMSLKTSKEEFYKKYSGVVMLYQRLCDSLSKLQYSSVSVDRLLKELSNSNETFQRQKYFSAELKNLKEEIKGLIESYKYSKEGMEETVRFYRGIQYVLSSYRIEEV